MLITYAIGFFVLTFVLVFVVSRFMHGAYICPDNHTYRTNWECWNKECSYRKTAVVASLPFGSLASVCVIMLVAHLLPNCSRLMLGLFVLLAYSVVASVLVRLTGKDDGSRNPRMGAAWLYLFFSVLGYAVLVFFLWATKRPSVPVSFAVEASLWSIGCALLLGVLRSANENNSITEKQQRILICLVCTSCFMGIWVRFAPIVSVQYSRIATPRALTVTIFDMENRLSDSLPQYRKTLESQVSKIQKLRAGASARNREVLDIELREIATALLAVEKFEAQCEDTHMELLSMRRKLERTDKADSVLGISYEELLTQTRKTVEKASLELSVKIDSIAGMDGISQAEIDRKVYQLMESGK